MGPVRGSEDGKRADFFLGGGGKGLEKEHGFKGWKEQRTSKRKGGIEERQFSKHVSQKILSHSFQTDY